MRRIAVSIQQGFLVRRGPRGRYLTAYLHDYSGRRESTERMHVHPWRLCFGIVLSGRMTEAILRNGRQVVVKRGPGSIRFYRPSTRHRIVGARGRTIFIGIMRTQREREGATCRVPEGYCHYTELMPGEEGFRPEFVDAA